MPNASITDRFLFYVAHKHAAYLFNQIHSATRRATALQEQRLLKKVRRHADSDFGRRHGFDRIRNARDYQERVPLQTYESLSPYIEQMKGGHFGALLGPGDRVLMFALTSGTTCEPKYIPVTPNFLAEYRAGWNAFGIKALIDHPGSFLRPILQVSSPMDEHRTEAGIPCGSISGLMAGNQKRIVRKFYVTPPAVARIHDADARYYTIIRLGVMHDVAFLITASPATQLKLARIGDAQRDRLIRDVHDGTLSVNGDVGPDIREAIAPRMTPNPAVAKRLEAIVQRTGRLLPRDYWNLGFIANWIGGTMNLYLQDFPEYFGDTPVRDIGLLASEGRMSIPIEDGTPAGILDATTHFYEFIPSEDVHEDNPRCLRSHELEVGCEYFIVLTTSSGLFRYAIGDQVRVVGHVNQAPVIEFLNKGDHISSLSGEKLTERQVVLTAEAIGSQMGLDLKEFVLAPRWDTPPHYMLYVDAALDAERAADLADRFDVELGRINIEYASKRKSERLGGVVAHCVERGRLRRLDESTSYRRRPGANEQFKHIYLLSQPGQDAALLDGETADPPHTGHPPAGPQRKGAPTSPRLV